MKKYIALFSFVAALMVTGCSVYTDEEPGGVATQDLCGTWVITVEASLGENSGTVDLSAADKAALDATDDWVDLHGVGKTFLRTYNTAANDADSIWFDDDNFWGEKFKISCNSSKLSFVADSVPSITGSGCEATIRYGQVLKGAATTPRGQKADSIIAYVFYNDGYDLTYKFSGFRYTGFAEDTY